MDPSSQDKLNRLIQRIRIARDVLVLTLCLVIVISLAEALISPHFEPVGDLLLFVGLPLLFCEAGCALYWMTRAASVGREWRYAAVQLGLALFLLPLLLLGAVVMPTLVAAELRGTDEKPARASTQVH